MSAPLLHQLHLSTSSSDYNERERGTEISPAQSTFTNINMLKFLALVVLATIILQTHLFISNAIPIPSMNSEIDTMLVRNSLIGEDEELMPSEISRRVLMTQKRYIGYETLKRDMVPCQKPGASYYDCRSGQANSYSRGCDTITRCARDTSDINTWMWNSGVSKLYD